MGMKNLLDDVQKGFLAVIAIAVYLLHGAHVIVPER
jgi:hypothetical protein